MMLLGIFRFGFLDNVLSRPLLAGFVNAVAVIIAIHQIEPFLGLPTSHADSTYAKIRYAIDNIGMTNPLTLTLGAVTLGMLIGLRLIKWLFPSSPPS